MMNVAYLLCSENGLPFVIHVNEQHSGLAQEWSFPRSFCSRYWHALSQFIVMSAGIWKHRAPFHVKRGHIHCCVVPHRIGSNVLYSCCLWRCHNPSESDPYKMNMMLAAFVALQACLQHTDRHLHSLLPDLTARMDNRIHDSTFADTVAGDEWWEDYIAQHPVQEALQAFRSGFLMNRFQQLLGDAPKVLETHACFQSSPIELLLYHHEAEAKALTPMLHASSGTLRCGILSDELDEQIRHMLVDKTEDNDIHIAVCQSSGGGQRMLVCAAAVTAKLAMVLLVYTLSLDALLTAACPPHGAAFVGIDPALLTASLREALHEQLAKVRAAVLLDPH